MVAGIWGSSQTRVWVGVPVWRLGEGARPSEDGSSHTAHLEDLDVSDAIFSASGLTMFCRLDGLGSEVTGQHVTPGRAVLECRIVDADDWCRNCGGRGLARDMVSCGRPPTMRSSLKASGC